MPIYMISIKNLILKLIKKKLLFKARFYFNYYFNGDSVLNFRAFRAENFLPT